MQLTELISERGEFQLQKRPCSFLGSCRALFVLRIVSFLSIHPDGQHFQAPRHRQILLLILRPLIRLLLLCTASRAIWCAGTVKLNLAVMLFEREKVCVTWADSWGLTGWFCAVGICLKKTRFQKGRNETFSFLILLQKNISSRGYALSYGITAHFFRVSAAFVILLYCPCQPEQLLYWDTWLYAILSTEMCHLHCCVENHCCKLQTEEQ